MKKKFEVAQDVEINSLINKYSLPEETVVFSELDENEIILNHLIEHIKATHKLQGKNHFKLDMDCNTLDMDVTNELGILIELPELVEDQQEYLQEFFSERLKELGQNVIVKCNL